MFYKLVSIPWLAQAYIFFETLLKAMTGCCFLLVCIAFLFDMTKYTITKTRIMMTTPTTSGTNIPTVTPTMTPVEEPDVAPTDGVTLDEVVVELDEVIDKVIVALDEVRAELELGTLIVVLATNNSYNTLNIAMILFIPLEHWRTVSIEPLLHC